MLLNLPVVYHGEFLNRKTGEWAPHNFVKLDETFEIEDMDERCVLAATGLNAPGLPIDLEVYWHDEATWIRDTSRFGSHSADPAQFDPFDKKCLLALADGAAVREHCEGNQGMWPPTAQDHWVRWAKRESKSPNPKTYSAFRNLTLEAERQRMREFTAGLRLLDGVL